MIGKKKKKHETNINKHMKNLPKGMMPDRDNVVYYDTERRQFYIIQWEDGGNNDIPHRYYIASLLNQTANVLQS